MSGRRLFFIVRWLLSAQLIILILTTAVAGWWSGGLAAQSALLGGLIAWIPNLLFAARFGMRIDGRTARQVVTAFYSGETLKLLLTAALFIAVFQLADIRFAPLFVSYFMVIGVAWFALLVRGSEW